MRQDLIGDRESAESWADRLARIVAPLIAPPEARAPQDWGSRARGGAALAPQAGRVARLDAASAPGHGWSRKSLSFHIMDCGMSEDTVATGTEAVNAGHLRAFIERIERLEEEKKALSDDIKDVYAEAKGNGFDVKIIRKIVSIRKQDRDKRREEEEILDLYLAALGMG